MSYENDLAHEYPQHKEHMQRLKQTDAHFRKLFEEYDTLGKEIHRIAVEAETPEDAYVESCKKKRLALKDQIVAMLTRNAA